MNTTRHVITHLLRPTVLMTSFYVHQMSNKMSTIVLNNARVHDT